MDPEELRAIGVALYGDYFIGRLALNMAINERTVRRWLAGNPEMSTRMRETVADVCTRRIKELEVEHKAKVKQLREYAAQMSDVGI